MNRKIRDRAIPLLVGPLLITLAFLGVILTKRTIAPVDLYWAAPGYYQLGSPESVSNHYPSDVTNVSLPVKYYLMKFQPESCKVSLEARGLSREVTGFRLPQHGSCYPIGAVRPYLMFDSFLPLSKVFDFFTAYDLSHLLLMLAYYFAAFFLLIESLPTLLGGTVARAKVGPLAAIGASLLTTSFPAARDLQFDTLEAGMPLLLSAIALLLKFARSTRGYGYLALGFVALSGSFTKVNLQGLAQNTIFLALYLGAFHVRELKLILGSKAKTTLVLLAGVAALGVGTAFHSGGVLVFLGNPEQFVPNRNLSALDIVLRRSAVWLLSFGHFLGGELAMSFRTFDPLKLFPTLGGREYPSYDWATFFLSPVVSLFSIALLLQRRVSSAQKSAIRLGLIMMALDLLLILLPTYRLIYLRLHPFLLATSFTVVFVVLIADLKIKLTTRELIKTIIPMIAALFLGAAVVVAIKGQILQTVQGKGTFGFEPEFWPLHIDRLLALLTFRDPYTWFFLATGAAGLVLINARNLSALSALIAASGLLLNTFHYNSPMKRELFYSFLEKFEQSTYEKDQSTGPGLFTAPNINFLLNRPITRLYESLEIKKSTGTGK